MKIAVVQFPGSNCDQDALYSLRDDLGVQAEYVWHQESSLAGFDGVFIPGGFTYGDYLRCGAMAARSAVMGEVIRMVNDGHPVMGACNGFQILCETGVLPGALLKNSGERFLCKSVYLKAENRNTAWTEQVNEPIAIPIAHNEGRFVASDDELARIENEGLVAFRYCEANGELTEKSNVNGSLNHIAGLVNKRGNVLGLMPHPERMTKKILGSDAGLLIISGFHRVLAGV
ncbi:MAG: phosphoribosylformylglycinamidine synthase subunit PurQ [Fimbriimonadaceae bacterium]|nr:MAG: phosphoribosylformylglycinamidine synthase subunit PurQ [Fimbriimonadaceae bacterium]